MHNPKLGNKSDIQQPYGVSIPGGKGTFNIPQYSVSFKYTIWLKWDENFKSPLNITPRFFSSLTMKLLYFQKGKSILEGWPMELWSHHCKSELISSCRIKESLGEPIGW